MIGCASLDEMPVVDAAKPVKIDPAVLTLCPMLKEDIKIFSFDDVVTVYGDLATAYGVCANKQADSVKLLKQMGGIKDGNNNK